MASDCKSPRKKKGKLGEERKWEEKAGKKAERQVDRHKDWQRGKKTSRQKVRQGRYVGLSILSD